MFRGAMVQTVMGLVGFMEGVSAFGSSRLGIEVGGAWFYMTCFFC